MTNHYSSRPTSFLSDTSSSIWTRFSTIFHKRRSKYLHHPTHSSTSFSTCTSSSSITQASTSTTLSTTLHDDSIYESTAPCPTTTTTPITKTKDATTPLSEDNKSMFAVPPYSPTYCKANEFPYSNFYVKLPDGRYMIRYRSGNREILGTEIIEGYML